MREKIDQGLQELQARQGKGGLPAAPPSALAQPVNALVAENVPPPDPNGDKELTQQAVAADGDENEVLSQVAGGADVPPTTDVAPAPAATVSLSPGRPPMRSTGSSEPQAALSISGPRRCTSTRT